MDERLLDCQGVPLYIVKDISSYYNFDYQDSCNIFEWFVILIFSDTPVFNYLSLACGIGIYFCK